MKWSEMFPEGRTVFYEGKTPDLFKDEMIKRYEFDPSKDNHRWNKTHGYQFHCPNHCIDEVYGSRKYPLGS